MALSAGQFTRKCELLAPSVRAVGTTGERTATWARVAWVWAAMGTPTGRRAVIAEQLAAVGQRLITIRRPGDFSIKPLAYRIRYTPSGGAAETYEIQAVMPDDRGDDLNLACSFAEQ